jgi:hypothetical protein
MKAFISLLAFTSLASADPAPTDPKLAQLVGHWQGGGTFTMNGKPMQITITYECARAAIGPGIACSAFSKAKDFAYGENHLFGYDKATNTYHLFSVNDLGEAYDHAAKWTDAGKVAFQYDATVDGKPVREIYTYTAKKDVLVLHGTFTRDGKVIGDGEYTVKRAP